MIYYKTKEEIAVMAKEGRILAEVLEEVLRHIKPGVSELELDRLTEELIVKKGAKPGFKKVKGYNYTLCTSTNDVVVHGIPGNYQFQEGDVVGIDCGVYYQGFYTDMAETIQIKNDNEKIKKFLETGERALEEAIKVAKIGNRIGHISKVIQEIIEGAGYSVVRSLVGHGIGRDLHEEPEIPGFVVSPIEKTPLLKEGMTIAIEVIYNMGKSEVVLGKDNWTIKTKDGSLSSVFEKTIAIAKNGPVVLTK